MTTAWRKYDPTTPYGRPRNYDVQDCSVRLGHARPERVLCPVSGDAAGAEGRSFTSA